MTKQSRGQAFTGSLLSRIWRFCRCPIQATRARKVVKERAPAIACKGVFPPKNFLFLVTLCRIMPRHPPPHSPSADYHGSRAPYDLLGHTKDVGSTAIYHKRTKLPPALFPSQRHPRQRKPTRTDFPVAAQSLVPRHRCLALAPALRTSVCYARQGPACVIPAILTSRAERGWKCRFSVERYPTALR